MLLPTASSTHLISRIFAIFAFSHSRISIYRSSHNSSPAVSNEPVLGPARIFGSLSRLYTNLGLLQIHSSALFFFLKIRLLHFAGNWSIAFTNQHVILMSRL